MLKREKNNKTYNYNRNRVHRKNINDVKYNIYLSQRNYVNLLVYIIVYPFMWLISRMSFVLIYLFSDMMYYLIYYIFSYRKKVVRENLKLAFPKMSIEERIKIEKKYYRYLSDIFLESFKSMNISEDEMKKRYKFKNPELLDRIYDKNQNLILLS